MAIKIENASSLKLPKNAEKDIESIMASLPPEHLRGIGKIRLVDFISDPRLKDVQLPKGQDLPGLYRPKQGVQNAYLEVATGAILRPTESYVNRMMARTGFKANLASVLFSLVGQHYYLTQRHSVKRADIEPSVRQYAMRHLKTWGETQADNSFRARLFKPLRPLLERWAKSLNKKAQNAQKKAKA